MYGSNRSPFGRKQESGYEIQTSTCGPNGFINDQSTRGGHYLSATSVEDEQAREQLLVVANDGGWKCLLLGALAMK